MRLIGRLFTFVTLFLALTFTIGAQDREGVMGDLIRDVTARRANRSNQSRAVECPHA